jgi:hypothetical protein
MTFLGGVGSKNGTRPFLAHAIGLLAPTLLELKVQSAQTTDTNRVNLQNHDQSRGLRYKHYYTIYTLILCLLQQHQNAIYKYDIKKHV